jgi:hypothetical protein
MTQLLLIFHAELEICLTIVSVGDGLGVVVPTNGQPGLQVPFDCCVWRCMKLMVTAWVLERETHCSVALWIRHNADGNQQKLQRAIRVVHSRAATCVAAGGGICEIQLEA